jgi:hypothetical protein
MLFAMTKNFGEQICLIIFWVKNAFLVHIRIKVEPYSTFLSQQRVALILMHMKLHVNHDDDD